MFKKFLKRFEKLENRTNEATAKQAIKITKRFEHLEIGDRKIDITITDKIIQQEEIPLEAAGEIKYYILCPYCGGENDYKLETCKTCKHPLKTRLAADFQEKARLKKCICGAMNQGDRKSCWVCGKDFFWNSEQNNKIGSDNIITLNLDGKIYKSSDKYLPLDIRILIERIRKEGYSKDMVDDWIKKKQKEEEFERDGLKEEIETLRSQYDSRRLVLIISTAVGIIYIILRFLFSR